MIDLKKGLTKRLHQIFSDNPRVIIIAVAVVVVFLVIASRMEKRVSIVVNGEDTEIATFKSSVRDVLASARFKIEPKDKVLPGLDNNVENDMMITIKKAVPVTVMADGKVLKIDTAEDTVEDMLQAEGIVLNDKDKIIPDLKSAIKSKEEVTIVRVEEKLMVSTETIAYETVKKTDYDMAIGTTKVLQDGTDGEKEVTTKVVYEDGREVSRGVVGENIKKVPVNKIVAVGSLSWFVPSRGGEKVAYVRKLRMKATSYTNSIADCGKTNGITASGMHVKRDPNGYSTVAVDPRVIPLGTKLYVVGYGLAIAADVGGAVKGNIIDLYFPPDQMGKGLWSTHYTEVYVLK